MPIEAAVTSPLGTSPNREAMELARHAERDRMLNNVMPLRGDRSLWWLVIGMYVHKVVWQPIAAKVMGYWPFR